MQLIPLIKGVTVAVFGFFTAFLGIIFFTLTFGAATVSKPRTFRLTFDRIISFWEYLITGLLEVLLGIKVVFSGTPIRRGECSLLLMNHRTRLDWMYFWSILARQSGIHTEKIVLKWELKHVPGAGWAMQIASFIFLNRKWEEDKAILGKMLDYYSRMQHKTQVLLFPEGTDFNSKSKGSSDSFAAKNNLPSYEHVLHPRTTGFTYMIQRMAKNQQIDAVYDVTVGYPGRFPQNEADFVSGNFPSEVHFHIQRYDIENLPTSEEGLSQWLQERWAEKEQLLTSFKETKDFEACEKNRLIAGDSTKTASMPNGIKTDLQQKDHKEHTWPESTITLRYYVAIAFWVLFMVVSLYLLYVSVLARVLAVLQVVLFLVVGRVYGGLELFLAGWNGRNKKTEEVKQD